jgi:hypothetical protein
VWRRRGFVYPLKKILAPRPGSPPAQIVELDKARLKRNLLDRVADAKTLLRRHTTQARQILKRLLEKPLICEVIEEGGKKGYRVTGQGSYLHLIPESLASPFVVSPTGLVGFSTIEFQGVVQAA